MQEDSGVRMQTLAFFFKCKFSLLVVVFVLSSTPVFTSLYSRLVSVEYREG
jgi:hypothetical protein